MGLFQKKPIINILSPKQTNEKGVFLKRIGSLLQEGYSLKDALSFLKKIEKDEPLKWVNQIQIGALQGYSFHQQLEVIGFSNKVCAQIYLGAQTGQYGQVIIRCGEQLLDRVEKEKKLKSLATYPIILVLFLLGMMLLMRFMVLPHMETLLINTDSGASIYANQLVWLVYYSPQAIILGLTLILLITFLLYVFLKKKTVLEAMNLFASIPILRRYLKDYYTHFYFTEWGQLFQNGYSFQEILQLMQGEQASALLKESGALLSKEMQLGKALHESLDAFLFLHPQAQEIIMHGENLGKLSTEMLMYANYCEDEFNQRLEKMMEKLQPVIFIFVALMIIAIYGALMLPVFTLMEGF